MLLRLALYMLMAAGLAGFGAVAWISTRPPPAAPVAVAAPVAMPVTVSLLAAAHTLRPGVLLKPEDLTTVIAVQSAVPEGARIDTPATRAELLGAMLRHTVMAGEVLLPMHIMRAGERGFLAAVLGPGLRATTVGVDAVSGTAGLIWPGDHVDLILTETLDDPAAPLGRRIAGETVLHNVRVIAIDQELMQGANACQRDQPGIAGMRKVPYRHAGGLARQRRAHRCRHPPGASLSLSVISADTAETSIEPTTPIIPATLTTPITPTIPGAPLEVAVQAPITWGSDVSSALLGGPQRPIP